MVALADFIAETRAEPFQWGVNDCALWCASAVQHCTGFDPAADLRGTYDNWMDCRRIVMKAGGLLGLVPPRMEHPLLGPLDGDGVAVMRFGPQVLCALIVGGRAIARNETGLVLRDDYTVLKGWSWR